MRILLIEDDAVLGAAVRDQIAGDGHSVDWVQRLDAADTAIAGVPYDLVLLDLMLPDGRGLPFLRRLRARGEATPVIILTALDQVSDRIEGLNAGADDYLVKPFALSELAARIEAVLRRSLGGGKRSLQVGELSYDLDTLEVTRSGRPLKLNPVGLKLLALLMQKSPHVVRREVLEEALWGDDCPDSDSLRSHVHQLRQVIDKPFDRALLHNVHGVGYRLAERVDGV